MHALRSGMSSKVGIDCGVLERAARRSTLLDGAELTLQAEDLVIADAGGAVGLAGVMGGKRSAVSRGNSGSLSLEIALLCASGHQRDARVATA